jgi:cytochrome c2
MLRDQPRSWTLRRTSILFARVLGFGLVFVAGAATARYQSRRVDRVVMGLKSLIISTDAIAEDLIKINYSKTDHVSNPGVRTLDTSRLPLILTESKLAETGLFASGIGGSLATVEGALFTMDRLGNIFRFTNNTLERMDYGELPTNSKPFLVERAKSGERDPAVLAHYFAFDEVSGTLFVSHQRFNATSKRQRFVVSALSIDGKTLQRKGTWQTIFESEDITQSDTDLQVGGGGKLLVSGDFLYFTVGDFAEAHVLRANQLVAQDPESSFGKLFEYDIKTHKTRKKAIGLRNPLGVVRTNDGKLITSENGPEGGDELNGIVDGQNYGWPYHTYGTLYGQFTWPLPVANPTDFKFVEPLFAWVPSAAISSIIQVNGFSPEWNGDLFVGSLKARTLYRLKYVEGRIIFSEPIWVGHRIRDLVQLGTRLVLMTDDPSLVFVDIDQKRLAGNSKKHSTLELNPAFTTCMTCHHFGPTNPSQMAPSLSDLLQRNIADDDFANYSEGLRNRKGSKWTEKSLEAFLRDPTKYGSSMPNLNLSEPNIREIVRLIAK